MIMTMKTINCDLHKVSEIKMNSPKMRNKIEVSILMLLLLVICDVGIYVLAHLSLLNATHCFKNTDNWSIS